MIPRAKLLEPISLQARLFQLRLFLLTADLVLEHPQAARMEVARPKFERVHSTHISIFFAIK